MVLVHTMISGHHYGKPDMKGSNLRRIFKENDFFNDEQIRDKINEKDQSTTAILLQKEAFCNWEAFLDPLFCNVEGVREGHVFLISFESLLQGSKGGNQRVEVNLNGRNSLF